MNWGKGIAIALAIYIVGILFLVYKTTSVDFELVTEDYYAKELAYQDQIDKMKNVKDLGADVEVEVSKGQVDVVFPITVVNGEITGTILFFRPSGGKHDRTLEIELDNSGTMVVNTAEMLPGNYNLQIEWKAGDKEMYSEESIYLL